MRAEVTFRLTEDEHTRFTDIVSAFGIEVLNETVRKSYDCKSNELIETEIIGLLAYKGRKHQYKLIKRSANDASAEIHIDNDGNEIVTEDNDIFTALTGKFKFDTEIQERRKLAKTRANKSQMAINTGCAAIKIAILVGFIIFLIGLITLTRWIV